MRNDYRIEPFLRLPDSGSIGLPKGTSISAFSIRPANDSFASPTSPDECNTVELYPPREIRRVFQLSPASTRPVDAAIARDMETGPPVRRWLSTTSLVSTQGLVSEKFGATAIGSARARYSMLGLCRRCSCNVDNWRRYREPWPPAHRARLIAFPQGIHCGGSDPRRGGETGGPKGAPPAPARWRTSAKNEGVAPSTSSPSRRGAPGDAGTGRAPLRHGCRS